MKSKILFIVGPTASAKSDIAVEIAKQLNGEIVSADSMQIYKNMDIGTAKPSAEERRLIPHHLMDFVEPSENFSVYDFCAAAQKTVKEILAREHLPIITGGTGLYIRALLDGLSVQPGACEVIREKLETEAETNGISGLYSQLWGLDPDRASKIKPTDKKRIIRALEIQLVSGKTATQWHREAPRNGMRVVYETCVAGIRWDRETLYQRINERVERMFERGLAEEVQQLAGRELSTTAAQALGYKEVILSLKNGNAPDAAKRIVQQKTRNFAKRQMTWFKKEKDVVWFLMNSGKKTTDLADEIIRHFALRRY